MFYTMEKIPNPSSLENTTGKHKVERWLICCLHSPSFSLTFCPSKVKHPERFWKICWWNSPERILEIIGSEGKDRENERLRIKSRKRRRDRWADCPEPWKPWSSKSSSPEEPHQGQLWTGGLKPSLNPQIWPPRSLWKVLFAILF